MTDFKNKLTYRIKQRRRRKNYPSRFGPGRTHYIGDERDIFGDNLSLCGRSRSGQSVSNRANIDCVLCLTVMDAMEAHGF